MCLNTDQSCPIPRPTRSAQLSDMLNTGGAGAVHTFKAAKPGLRVPPQRTPAYVNNQCNKFKFLHMKS